MAIALLFGLAALRYPLGQFSRAGPGLFPLMVSCLLFVIGLTLFIITFAINLAADTVLERQRSRWRR